MIPPIGETVGTAIGLIFYDSNNKVVYEAPIFAIRIEFKMGAKKVQLFTYWL